MSNAQAPDERLGIRISADLRRQMVALAEEWNTEMPGRLTLTDIATMGIPLAIEAISSKLKAKRNPTGPGG